MRLLVLVGLAIVLWMFLELGLARLKSSLDKPKITESLVRCSGCGVYVPHRQVVEGRCEQCRT